MLTLKFDNQDISASSNIVISAGIPTLTQVIHSPRIKLPSPMSALRLFEQELLEDGTHELVTAASQGVDFFINSKGEMVTFVVIKKEN